MRRLGTTVGLVTLALVVVACAGRLGAGRAGSPSDEGSSLEGGTWVLRTASIDGEQLTVPDGHRVSLTVDGDEVGGTSACNHYGGTIAVDGDEVAIGELGGTAVGCAPAVMTVEETFLEALGRVSTADRDGNRLELAGRDVSLVFRLEPPVPDEDVVGTTWLLDSVVIGDTVASVGGDTPSLLLRDDGTLSGSTGCRELTGRYVVHGDEIVTTELEATGDCPSELEDQDAHVVTVLGDGFRVAVEGRRLTLSSDGDLGLGYVGDRR